MSTVTSVDFIVTANERKNDCKKAVRKSAVGVQRKISEEYILMLAHEVRNPLMNIDLSARLLESALTNAEDKTYIDIIKRGCLTINLLITELLKDHALAKVVRPKQSINQILNEILDSSRDRIFLKNIVVCKTYAAYDLKIPTKDREIKIALTNIIINAIDAMPQKGGQLSLSTEYFQDKYVVKIKDNGCGIKENDLQNIFQPYYTNKKDGLGIGLALTHNILVSYAIGINVVSKENNGTCFILSFINPGNQEQS